MSRKEITRYSASTTDFELPTARAELTIILVDLAGQREPVRWLGERESIAVRLKNAVARLIRRP
jgi:hypothetical protein